jgi:NAD-specific glutamate dehydrogenase
VNFWRFFEKKLRPNHLGDIFQKKMRPSLKNMAQSGHTATFGCLFIRHAKKQVNNNKAAAVRSYSHVRTIFVLTIGLK